MGFFLGFVCNHLISSTERHSFSFTATGNYVSSQSYNAKDELDRRVELIRRNVKNLLKIAKRDSWVCDRYPHAHGKYTLRSQALIIPKFRWIFSRNRKQ